MIDLIITFFQCGLGRDNIEIKCIVQYKNVYLFYLRILDLEFDGFDGSSSLTLFDPRKQKKKILSVSYVCLFSLDVQIGKTTLAMWLIFGT